MIPTEILHAQRSRLAELTALRRPLSEDEIAELLHLDDRERRRRALRHWRTRNIEAERQRVRDWRAQRRSQCASM